METCSGRVERSGGTLRLQTRLAAEDDFSKRKAAPCWCGLSAYPGSFGMRREIYGQGWKSMVPSACSADQPLSEGLGIRRYLMKRSGDCLGLWRGKNGAAAGTDRLFFDSAGPFPWNDIILGRDSLVVSQNARWKYGSFRTRPVFKHPAGSDRRTDGVVPRIIHHLSSSCAASCPEVRRILP